MCRTTADVREPYQSPEPSRDISAVWPLLPAASPLWYYCESQDKEVRHENDRHQSPPPRSSGGKGEDDDRFKPQTAALERLGARLQAITFSLHPDRS